MSSSLFPESPPGRAGIEIRELITSSLARSRPAVAGDDDLNPGYARALRPLRPAAVLVGLVERPVGTTVLFTRRTDGLRHHAGQISFPGGGCEPEDADATACALRETREEIGLEAGWIEVVGRLNSYVTGTGYAITPVVGFIRSGFAVTPDPSEVAEIFEVPLAFLLDPANHQRGSRTIAGGTRHFYAIPYGDYYIWGATASMLVDLHRKVYGR